MGVLLEQPGRAAINDCQTGGHIGTANNGNQMNQLVGQGWELTPPQPVGIVRVHNYALTDLAGSGAPAFGVNVDPAIAGPPGGDDRSNGHASLVADPPPSTHQIGVWCSAGAPAPCQLSRSVVLLIKGVTVDLAESAAPSGVVAGGSLLAGGPRSGAATLSYTAADGESGIERVEAVLGDTVVGVDDLSRNLSLPVSEQGSGPCTYTGIAACPPAVNRDIMVDTAKVPNGVHTLTLRVLDAAKNRTVVAGPQVTVANAAVATPNGQPASRQAKLSLSFTTTSKRGRRLRLRSRPTVKGRLVDEARRPIAGAAVVLSARRREANAPYVPVATVRTAPDGSFRHRMPSGPARTLRAAYTAFSTDAQPAAIRSLRVHVRATLSIRARRNGRRLTITGRLRQLPRSRVEIKVQARDGRRWRTIGETKTRGRGRFSFRYRFKRSSVGRTFAFRVRVDSPIYPFTPGRSRTIRVRAR